LHGVTGGEAMSGYPEWYGREKEIADEVEKLTRDLDEARTHWRDTVGRLNHERAEQKARIASLEAVLRQYGGHRGCHGWMSGRECKCGWRDVEAVLSAPPLASGVRHPPDCACPVCRGEEVPQPAATGEGDE